MSKVEVITKGEPYFIFFPINNKKGIQYNYEIEEEMIRMFIVSKS